MTVPDGQNVTLTANRISALIVIKSQEITHQRLVAVVIDERPFLGLGRGIKHMLLLFKLDTIGLLVEST